MTLLFLCCCLTLLVADVARALDSQSPGGSKPWRPGQTQSCGDVYRGQAGFTEVNVLGTIIRIPKCDDPTPSWFDRSPLVSGCNRWSWYRYFDPDCRDWRTGFLKCDFTGKADQLPCPNYVVTNKTYASDIVSLPSPQQMTSSNHKALFGDAGPKPGTKDYIDQALASTSMGKLSTIFFFDGDNAPGTCLNHIGPIYLHVMDQWEPEVLGWNTEEARARFFFADSYTCLEASTYSQVSEGAPLEKSRRLAFRSFNGATPFSEGIRFIDSKYEKTGPDRAYYVRVSNGTKFPIDKPYTYAQGERITAFPTMRSNTNNMWFATNYIFDMKGYHRWESRVYPVKATFAPLKGDQRSDRKPGDAYGEEWYTPLTPPGKLKTTRVQEQYDYHYCLKKNRDRLVVSGFEDNSGGDDEGVDIDFKYTGNEDAYDVFTYIPSVLRHDPTTTQRIPFDPRSGISPADAKKAMWSIGSYNGGQWQLGLRAEADPLESVINGYGMRCTRAKNNKDGVLIEDNRVGDTKCWAWHEHHHMISNRMSLCEFDEEESAIRCRNIREPNKMRCHKDATEDSEDQFIEGQDVDDAADFGDFPLTDALQYPSWNDMAVYMDAKNHAYNLFSDGDAENVAAGKPVDPIPILKPYGQVRFLLLPTDPVYACLLVAQKFRTSNCVDQGIKVTPSFLPSKKAVEPEGNSARDTRYTKLYGVTSETPMGRCPHACTESANKCVESAARCFCDPSTQSTGVGCEQRLNRTTVFNTTCAYWRDRGVDICSEAGECVDNTASGWPQCRCFDKFRGTPDQHKWKAVYASLFDAKRRSGTAESGLGARGLTSSWIDRRAKNLKTSISLVEGRVSNTQSADSIAVDWTEYIASHQCLIWTGGIREPPVRWKVNWNAYRDWSGVPDSNDVTPLSELTDVSIAYPDDPSQSDRLVYPWPLAAVTDQAGATYISNGLGCADYKDTSFVDFSDPSSQLSLFKTWRLDPFLNGTTLFGGEACIACPDCNRATSVCADRPEDIDKPAEQRRTYCKCNANYAGPLCQVAVCPGFSNGTFCGDSKRGGCPGYTATTYPMLTADQLASSTLITDVTLAQCQCNQGWSGTDCSVALCPVDSDGNICGSIFDNTALNRSASRGYCDVASGQCVCSDDWTGVDCSTPRCPVEPATGLECAGLVWYNNASRSVCNRENRECECWRALETAAALDGTSQYLDGNQNPVLDTSLYLNGRYGSACESTYSSQCLAEDGTWCGKVLGCSSAACNRRFAGCSILGCPGRADGTSAACGVNAGPPKCFCRPGFQGPRCETSVCGQFECDNPNGQDTGLCVVKCGKLEPGALCNMYQVSLGLVNQTGTCKCQTTSDGIRWMLNDTDQTCDGVVPAACVQSSVTEICGGEERGVCLRNPDTQAYQCYCKPGNSGTYCQTPDPCGGGACNTNGQRCITNLKICGCKGNYLFEASGSACTDERCVSTGGVITSLDEENCQCPDGRPMTVAYGSGFSTSKAVNYEVHKGCRKKCPIHPTTKVECGALPVTRPWPMCGDLLAGTPVWANSVNPAWAAGCTCNFLSNFGSSAFMFWESDGVGGCMPKCSLENSKGVKYATPIRGSTVVKRSDDIMGVAPGSVLSSTFECDCKDGWEGNACTARKCSGQASELRVTNINTGAIECFCTGTKWCYSGDRCQTDFCAPEGFCSDRTDQTTTNADCNCKLPAYGVQQSPLLKRGRRCVSLCQNGATPRITGATTAVCDCVPGSGTFGTYCENRVRCRTDRPQWGGPNCDINQCQNRGVPLDNAPGCDCLTPYLEKTPLCDGADVCALNNGVFRLFDRSCTCNPGWDKPSGQPNGLCVVNKCTAVGRPIDCRDTNCPGGYICECAPGYAFNGLTCAYIGSQITFCNPAYGRLRNISSVDPTLGATCVCKDGFGGDGCATYLCNSYEVPTGPGTCGCIYPFEGSECVNDFCPPNSVGPKRVLGFNGTLTNSFECECAVGYRLVKPTGRPQCIPDVTNCNPEGTLDWSPTVPLAECRCKLDWTGRGCFTSTVSAAFVKDLELRAEQIKALERGKDKGFNEAFADAWTTPPSADNLDYLWFSVGLVLAGGAIWRWNRKKQQQRQ